MTSQDLVNVTAIKMIDGRGRWRYNPAAAESRHGHGHESPSPPPRVGGIGVRRGVCVSESESVSGTAVKGRQLVGRPLVPPQQA